MLRRAGATQVTPHLGDFLQADPADPAFAAVTHILCDPSVCIFSASKLKTLCCMMRPHSPITPHLSNQCSGSGMVQRQDDAVEAIFGEEHDPSSDSRRLVALVSTTSEMDFSSPDLPIDDWLLPSQANFQKQIVCHAMRFPNVHRVSYSTCSIHEVSCDTLIIKTSYIRILSVILINI